MALTRELTVSEAEAFIYAEARMLDERRYDEWEELFTDDGVYWAPIDPEREPENSISVAFDDRTRIHERVYRLLKTPVLDQNPASRTVRFVSNVEVERQAGGYELVRCNQLIAEMRPGGSGQRGLNSPRMLAARCRYRLRPVDGSWRISHKTVVLLDADRPLYNLSFIL
jgi:3-phenylpropionate/cinnamic acid dioxygenase small subunit